MTSTLSTLRNLPRTYKATGAVALSIVGVYGVSSFATRDTFFREFSTKNDSLFNTDLYRRTNPQGNPTLHDLCVRKVDIRKVRPELVEDARNGGSRLVEEFCRGMWSGKVFAPQRTLLNTFADHGRLERELWTKDEIISGDIVPGTRVGGEFEVMTATPRAIVFRGGQPLQNQRPSQDSEVSLSTDLRDVDVLAELAVDIDTEENTVEFRFKGIFWCGTGVGSKPPLPAALDPVHRLYAAALLREGSQWCLK